MSVNIQLEGGLKKLSGQTMTKEKIIEKLGYTPAKDTISADIAEVASNVSNLKVALEDYIKNHPDIEEDGSGEVIFTDETGNIIAKFDAAGLHTTNVEADSFISSEDKVIVNDTDGNNIFQVDKDGIHTTKLELSSGDLDTQLETISAALAEHNSDSFVHVTEEDKYRWENKSNFSGVYEELAGAPNIKSDSDTALSITDNTGNIIAEIDEKGIHTTEVEAETFASNDDHLNITDASGNTIFSVDALGTHTTRLVTSSGDIDAQLDAVRADIVKQASATDTNISSVRADLAEHTNDSGIHVTAADKQKWNKKSDFSGSYNDLTDKPISQSGSDAELAIQDKSGNKIAQIDAEGLQTTKVKANELEADVFSSADDNLSIEDSVGNTVFKVDKSGVRTTKLRLDSGDIDVQLGTLSAAVAEQEINLVLHDAKSTHIRDKEREAWNNKVDADYVDKKIADLVNSAPAALDTLDELAAALGDDKNFATTVTNKLAEKADKTTVAEQLATKVDITRKINGKALSSDITLTAKDVGALPADAEIPSIEGLATEEYVNNTVSNYELKADASEKLTEAKEYAEDLMEVEGLTVQLGDGGSIGGYKTGDVITTGTSIKTILNKLLQKPVPATYTGPSVSLVSLGSAAGNYEYGTDITTQLKSEYTKNDAGGCSKLQLLLNDEVSFTLTNAGSFTTASTVSQLTAQQVYTAKAYYDEGAIKNNNLGDPSPEGHITAGSVTSSAVKFTPYRSGYFYGVLATDKTVPLTSAIIRSGTRKSGAYAAGNMPLISASDVDNRKRIFVACPATNKGITKVVMPSAMGADATADFVKQSSTVTVEGANGTTGIAYNVWVYEPASISDDQTFTVTLG